MKRHSAGPQMINIMHFKHHMEYLDRGRTRFVFLSNDKKWVIKVPANEQGCYDNEYEAWTYKKYKNDKNLNGMKFARCRLIPNSYILVMEYVNTNFNSYTMENRPAWVDFIDCGQVGFARDGSLVAYDYA